MVQQNEFEGFIPEGADGSSNPYPVQPYGFFLGIMGAVSRSSKILNGFCSHPRLCRAFFTASMSPRFTDTSPYRTRTADGRSSLCAGRSADKLFLESD